MSEFSADFPAHDNPQKLDRQEDEFHELGSLAQKTRWKEIKTARTILFIIGALTLLLNGFFFFMAEKLLETAFNKEVEQIHQQGMEIDQAALAEGIATATRATQIAAGIALAIGALYIVFGFIIYKSPVAITVTALVLYVGSAAVYGYLDPSTLMRGWIIKLIIIGALFKAVQAAIAYEKENRVAEETAAGLPPLG